MNKLIFTSDSPNTRKKDCRASTRLLFTPWRWKDGDSIDDVEAFFKKYYPNSAVFTFNYARSAMYTLMENLNFEKDSEVIFQSCTCAAATLPVLWAGLKPVYADIDKTNLSADLGHIKSVVSDKTKAIVIQYTMGFSPDVQKIKEFADNNDLVLIEDCTHFIPWDKESDIGSVGDFSLFSFGRDKVVSGVDGGVLVSHDKSVSKEIRKKYDQFEYPGYYWIFQRLLYSPLWVLIRKTYTIKVGKLIHLIGVKSGLLTKATSQNEKKGKKPSYIPTKLPNALAELAYLQLKDIDQIQMHRNDIAKIYRKNLHDVTGLTLFKENDITPLRYPLLIEGRENVLAEMKDKNILLGDWYASPVAPVEVSPDVSNYKSGSCPNAEYVAGKIVNLPTHVNISKEDASYITKSIKESLSTN